MSEEEINDSINNLTQNDIKAINGLVDFFDGLSGTNGLQKYKIPVNHNIKMTDEEKKAIEKLNSIIKVNNVFLSCVKNQTINQEEIKSIQIALNMIESFLWKEEQQKELLKYKTDKIEKQNKVIDEMAGSLYIVDAFSEYGNSTEEIKQYFYRKVERRK